MITTRLSGGLGNQMFQFAAGYSLAMQRDSLLTLDLTSLVHDGGCTPRNFGLNAFRLPPHKIQIRGRSTPFRRLSDKVMTIFGKIHFESCLTFSPHFFDIPNGATIDGYWQSEKYFANCSGIIRESFSLNSPLSGQSAAYSKILTGRPTVSIHFRRGDYSSNPEVAAIHGGICTPEYYNNALDFLENLFPGIQIAVFSDDHQWVRENYPRLSNSIFVEGNSSPIDLHLMSICQFNIIANSTFSWWGAWLNAYSDKKVIAPSSWFADNREIDIIPSEWIKIP